MAIAHIGRETVGPRAEIGNIAGTDIELIVRCPLQELAIIHIADRIREFKIFGVEPSQCAVQIETGKHNNLRFRFDAHDLRVGSIVGNVAQTNLRRLRDLQILVAHREGSNVKPRTTIEQIEFRADFIAVDGFRIIAALRCQSISRIVFEPATLITGRIGRIEHYVRIRLKFGSDLRCKLCPMVGIIGGIAATFDIIRRKWG